MPNVKSHRSSSISKQNESTTCQFTPIYRQFYFQPGNKTEQPGKLHEIQVCSMSAPIVPYVTLLWTVHLAKRNSILLGPALKHCSNPYCLHGEWCLYQHAAREDTFLKLKKFRESITSPPPIVSKQNRNLQQWSYDPCYAFCLWDNCASILY